MAFPALTEEQIDRIRSLERIRQVRRGDILFKPGDTAFPFLYAALGAVWKSYNLPLRASG